MKPVRPLKTTGFTQISPNIYKYRTAKGWRYAARLVLYGADHWKKGFLYQKDAGDYITEERHKANLAKTLPHLQPAPTLDAYAKHWLESREVQGLRPTTLRSYKQNLEQHVLPEFGAMPMNQISRLHIQIWLQEKQKELWGKDKEKEKTRRYSRHALRLMLAPLSAMFSDAIASEIVDRNPCLRPSKLIGIRKKFEEPVFYTAEQQAQLLAKAKEIRPKHYVHLLVLFWAGLRPGEAAALSPEDVWLDRGRIKISKTLAEGVIHDTPKNGQTRLVEIQPELRPDLARYLTKRRLRTKILFPNEVGEYLDPSNWRRRVWDPIVKAADVPALSPYAARHSYATRMLEQKQSLAWLQVQMGHSSISVTIANYGHLAEQI